jgi:HK97 family phage portal protein
MSIFNRLRRSGAPAPAVPAPAPVEARRSVAEAFSSDPGLAVKIFGMGDGFTDEVVNVDTALTVPAVLCAVSFLSRTLASVPIKIYDRADDGTRARVSDDPVGGMLARAANDETTGADFRRVFWQDVFTYGRGVAFIERNRDGIPINLWPLQVSKLTIRRENRRKIYHYRDGARVVSYTAADVIDLPFMVAGNGIGAVSPVYSNAITIGLTLAMMRYGGRVFRNGGIPPFSISGPIKSPGGVGRAADDLMGAVKKLAAEGGNAITIPEGHELKPLGIDPEKMQMTDGRRFQIEECARIWQLPPVFLQDLTRATFSNIEEQDLHLVKHLVSQWAGLFEAEVTLKAYGRTGPRYAEHDLDGLMRGDLRTRAEARAAMIHSGQLTANEARAQDNRPPVEGGERALVQGAMIPLANAGAAYDGSQNGGSGDG